jgi:large subunit ribosomal protein L25
MERFQFQANPREISTKGRLRELRRQGQVPGIVYGKKTEPVAVSVDSKTLTTVLHSPAGLNTLVDLSIGDRQETVMVKQLDREILQHDRFTHVDFVSISLKDKLEVHIPVILIGEPVGVRDGGIVQQSLREVTVKCLPTQIPEQIELDVSSLGVGESLFVNELNVPDGSELLNDSQEVVVTLVPPRVAEEGAEGAETAEADAAEEEKAEEV